VGVDGLAASGAAPIFRMTPCPAFRYKGGASHRAGGVEVGKGAVLRRLLLVPPTLFGVAVVVFVLLRVVPGDPVSMMIPPGASQIDVDRLRAHYGLDLPIFQQFLVWLKALLAGDFGTSISRRVGVMGLILSRLPATLELVLLATFIAFLIGGGMALLGAYFRKRAPEWIVDGFVALSLAVPDFLWGLIFILAFGVLIPVLPISGRIDPRLTVQFHTGFYLIESVLTGDWRLAGDLLRHAVLPAIALALPLAAIVTRVFKASLAEAELQDYAQIARARGFTRARVLFREALPNAAITTVTLAGVQITFLIGGTVLVERIFSYEGIGNMAVDAMINRDLPLIQGLVLTFAVLFIGLNLLIDLVTSWLDPRLQNG
jgi:ABC-type dipeptide/oligopeptide/nickel transport system permease component